MFRLFTIVGARPQFIKAAALSRVLRSGFSEKMTESIVHTGQHYDADMSEVFFEELGIPRPDYHLHVGSSSHGAQTGTMLQSLEQLLLDQRPDAVLVYGDTNSTLAGALAASKIGIPVVHVEAGLRSFNKAMPEEINRILTDHVSSLLFAPTGTGIENLTREGFHLNMPGDGSPDKPRIFQCGDVMFDNALYFKSKAAEHAGSWFAGTGLQEQGYFLATIHRNANTDDPVRLKALLQGLDQVSVQTGMPVVWPLHPRTRKMLDQFSQTDVFFRDLSPERFRLLPPASYLQMVLLEARSRMILTDSGGVQKEAYFYQKPCVVLRPETEWVELVSSGAAVLADADATRLITAVHHFLSAPYPAPEGFYGNGHAATFIAETVVAMLESQRDSANWPPKS